MAHIEDGSLTRGSSQLFGVFIWRSVNPQLLGQGNLGEQSAESRLACRALAESPYVYVNMHVHIYVYAYMYMYKYMCMYMHVYMYTRICLCL